MHGRSTLDGAPGATGSPTGGGGGGGGGGIGVIRVFGGGTLGGVVSPAPT